MVRLGEQYRVEDLVPHRGAMSLLDSIAAYCTYWLRATLGIRPDSTFAGPGGVPAWVGIEYLAQAAAAFGGIEQVQRGERPAIGLLIGARYYRAMLDTFPVGMKLTVFAQIAMRDTENFAAYDCTLETAGERVAECVLKAYRPHDLAPILAGDSPGARRG